MRPSFSISFVVFITFIIVLKDVAHAFIPSHAVVRQRPSVLLRSSSSNTNDRSDGDDDENKLSEADRLRQQAEQLRAQIRSMEEKLGENRKRNYDVPTPPESSEQATTVTGPTLRKKRVLVAGANGRLGSMVCRYLLRNHPQTEVVAAVHTIGENSPTARGYGRLSYEVGAEDGVGRIGAAWSSEDRTATFEYDPDVMQGYNLQNLRLVECELLDPVQCRTVTEGCDAVIWCATDFNGNTPRAVSGLNVAFLFRAISRPAKGRVEIEGLQNMLGALKVAKQEAKRNSSGVLATSGQLNAADDPINFIHVSMAPGTYSDFETPFGSFWGIKSQSEDIVRTDFPSLTTAVLQFCAFDDTFVQENLELQFKDVTSNPISSEGPEGIKVRRINRRDAARATVDALLKSDLVGKTCQIWTDER